MKTNAEKHISEEDMLSSGEMKFFESLKQNLQQNTPEPPEKIDSFIKAAARQRLKKQSKKSKTYFIFWSTGIAAVFAFSFSFMYISSTQPASPEGPVATTTNQASATTPAATSVQTAAAETDTEITDLAWNNMMLELNDFSSELNDTDMEVAAFSTWDQNYAIFHAEHAIKK